MLAGARQGVVAACTGCRTTDTTPDGVARLAGRLPGNRQQPGSLTGRAWRRGPLSVVISSAQVTPSTARSGVATRPSLNHSLERVIQRGRQLAMPLRANCDVALPRGELTTARDSAVELGFRQILVPGYLGGIGGDFEPGGCRSSVSTLSCPSMQPRHAAAATSWSSWRWAVVGRRTATRTLVPAIFYAGRSQCAHGRSNRRPTGGTRELLRRPHEPGADWFGLARAQRIGRRSAVVSTANERHRVRRLAHSREQFLRLRHFRLLAAALRPGAFNQPHDAVAQLHQGRRPATPVAASSARTSARCARRSRACPCRRRSTTGLTAASPCAACRH